MSRAQLTSTVEQNTGGAAAPVVAGKNFLANGGFDIWQRGTTGFGTTQTYNADRWFSSYNVGTVTISQQTTGVPAGATYCLRATNGAASSISQQRQFLESGMANSLAGQTVTFSVKLRRNSTFAANIAIGIYKNSTANTSTGGTWSLISNVLVVNSSLPTGTGSSNWYTATLTVAIPNDGTAAGIAVAIEPQSTDASGAYWEMAQAQLELGSVATPFSRAGGTLQGELALCQRYYYRQTAQTAYSLFGSGIAYSTTAINGYVKFPITMRTAPASLDISSNLGVYDGANLISATFALNTLNTLDIGSVIATSSGLTQWRPYHFISNNSTSSYFGFSAEL